MQPQNVTGNNIKGFSSILTNNFIFNSEITLYSTAAGSSQSTPTIVGKLNIAASLKGKIPPNPDPNPDPNSEPTSDPKQAENTTNQPSPIPDNATSPEEQTAESPQNSRTPAPLDIRKVSFFTE